MSRMGRFKDYGDCPVPKQPKSESHHGDTDDSDRDAETDRCLQQELEAEETDLHEMRVSRRSRR